MMAVMYLILDLDSAGLDLDVLMNGISVVEERSLTAKRRAVKLNGWVIEGDNLIEVRIAKPLNAAAVPTPRLTLSLRQATPGPSTVDDKTLLTYTWAADQPVPTGVPAAVLSRHLSLHAPRAWSWVNAPPITQLSEQDRKEIISLLNGVEQALSGKRAAEVVNLQRLSLTEQAEANGSDPAATLRNYDQFLKERMSQHDWRVEPLVASDLQLLPLAGGRLIHVIGARGNPPLIARTADSAFMIDPYLCRVDGRWTIVR